MFAPGCLANSTNSLRSNMTDHSFHGMPFLLEVCMPLSECYPCLRTVLPMSPVHTWTRGDLRWVLDACHPTSHSTHAEPFHTANARRASRARFMAGGSVSFAPFR